MSRVAPFDERWMRSTQTLRPRRKRPPKSLPKRWRAGVAPSVLLVHPCSPVHISDFKGPKPTRYGSGRLITPITNWRGTERASYLRLLAGRRNAHARAARVLAIRGQPPREESGTRRHESGAHGLRVLVIGRKRGFVARTKVRATRSRNKPVDIERSSVLSEFSFLKKLQLQTLGEPQFDGVNCPCGL
jgi:hypothetical protein